MYIELFDTHCHLNLPENFPDPEPFFESAKKADVNRLALVALDLVSSRRAIELAESHEGVYAIVGRHPNYAADYVEGEIAELAQLLQHPKVVALGEIGLDFHWEYATREQQEVCLRDQLELAERLDKPIVFHCREAYPDLLTKLESRRRGDYLFHCFAGDAVDAERAKNLNCYFGFDGPLTYKKSDSLRELVASLPRDRVVIETDSPYMTPEPFRGKPNEPANVVYINKALSAIWNCGTEETARITTENAMRFFRIGA